ncbi:Golgi SNAP receptor complex member 1 isoform X3 [Mustela nigripes]|uniref:Golgi SNAP receptor complex member 1 isoform X3 n=1 Tax=Mustela nigripes TaxID=77151 RepID=UPI00281641AE|nr:Golgi SNAP receptor complex member 1 isoform X3 [Mustela nigripes]
MAAGTSNYWEDLRKQARQLENELDLKLVSFSKLCTSYSHSSARDGRRDRYSSDTTPLLNGSSQDRMFETMAIEIEQLLARLTGVNDKMAEYTNSAGVPSLNAALMHTLQRHRDILQDYTHEFHKTKANFMAIRERENLMGSVRKDIESYKSGSGVNNRRTELFLKEHDHLRKERRRERAPAGEQQAEGEGEAGSLLIGRQTQGSRPEPKQMLNPLSHPGTPVVWSSFFPSFFFTGAY